MNSKLLLKAKLMRVQNCETHQMGVRIAILLVIAAATGRTLVLPPNRPLYLLKGDTSSVERSMADFVPLHNAALEMKVDVITTKEFLEREGRVGGRLEVNENIREGVWSVIEKCVHRAKSELIIIRDVSMCMFILSNLFWSL